MGFEEAIAQNFVSRDIEKSYVDKLLARNEIEQTKQLVKKARLTRTELLELLYNCTSAESKLCNFSEWERYIILKYFAWLREFAQIAEMIYDNEEILEKKEKESGKQLTDRGKHSLENTRKLIEHITKFNVDVYLNIQRTSLSISGGAFSDILNNRFEISYPQMNQQPVVPQKQGIFNKIFGG